MEDGPIKAVSKLRADAFKSHLAENISILYLGAPWRHLA